MSTPRHRSREIALQAIFALDAEPDADVGAAIARFFSHFVEEVEAGESGHGGEGGESGQVGESAEPRVRRDDRAWTESLVRGVWTRRTEIDEALARVSRNWRVDRMARVDRSVMRLALYELLHEPEVPVPVVIDEAVELAKRYGAEDASAFVNGVLDRAVTELGIARDRGR